MYIHINICNICTINCYIINYLYTYVRLFRPLLHVNMVELMVVRRGKECIPKQLPRIQWISHRGKETKSPTNPWPFQEPKLEVPIIYHFMVVSNGTVAPF